MVYGQTGRQSDFNISSNFVIEGITIMMTIIHSNNNNDNDLVCMRSCNGSQGLKTQLPSLINLFETAILRVKTFATVLSQ